MSVFLYALKAPESKRQYPKRLKVFLDYLKLGGSLGQQAIEFLSKAKQNPQWSQNSLMNLYPFRNEEQIIVKYHILRLVTITKLLRKHFHFWRWRALKIWKGIQSSYKNRPILLWKKRRGVIMGIVLKTLKGLRALQQRILILLIVCILKTAV